MNSAAVINEGPDFLTLRKSTHDLSEVAATLQRRGVRQVFKGDQNQLWDAVLTNQCLRRAIRDQVADGLCLFIQDEKLGTPDSRLIPYWRRERQDFALTEDYYGRRSGAVWEHQDVVHGLFYTEAVSSAQFAAAALHLPRAARIWERFAVELQADERFCRAWEALGVSASAGRSDAATRLGPPVHAQTYAELFGQDREAELFYRLTKSTGLYG